MKRKPQVIFARNVRLELEGKFETGIFWELYSDLERQFQNFLEYVPFHNNEYTYSFKLLNLILSIGGHIDSAFKEMARYSDFSTNKNCEKILRILRESEENVKKGKPPKPVGISLPLKAFDKEYGIFKEKIIFKCQPEGELITPFLRHNPKTGAPEWWEVYNELKHDVGINIEKANLRNTLHALAGACLLNVRHIPAVFRLYDSGLLKLRWAEKFYGKPACEEILREQVKDMLGKESPFYVETPLFIYNYGRG